MIVSSFNIQNNYSNYSDEKSKIISNYLEQNKIDILGLQEVFSPCSEDLEKCFPNTYRMVGNYRFFFKRLFKKVNEKTPIVTKYPILKYKTYHLPHFPSLLRRVLTKAIIEIDGQEISIYNTHLDFQFMSARKRELKKILRLIRKDTNPIILMGDFNLKNNKPIFNQFEDELNKIGIRRVEFNDKTLKVSQYHREIDHIFISYEFQLNERKIIKNIDTSDHYPIIVDISL